jgi:hypothetical protein
MKVVRISASILSCGALLAAVGGCADQGTRSDVPLNAVQVASGGKVVAFTAPHDGKAYLNDDTDHRVVYSTELKRDQIMRFDPASDTVRINGNSAPEGIDNPGNDHSIYFIRSQRPDSADAVSNAPIDSNDKSIPTVRVPIGIQVDVQPQPTAPK